MFILDSCSEEAKELQTTSQPGLDSETSPTKDLSGTNHNVEEGTP